jgi:hypothetical protein
VAYSKLASDIAVLDNALSLTGTDHAFAQPYNSDTHSHRHRNGRSHPNTIAN